MLSKREIQKLLWTCDIEQAGGHPVQLNLTVHEADRELLRKTARSARVTQTGVLKLGLRLAALAVAELVSEG